MPANNLPTLWEGAETPGDLVARRGLAATKTALFASSVPLKI